MTKQTFGEHEHLARAAAVEYAEKAYVGALLETVDEGESSISYLFASKLKGYEGWRWSVTLFEGAPEKPTVSEVVLLPGTDSLLAPSWVPWSERLADWKALQVELEAQAALDAAENDVEADSDETEESEDGDDAKWSDSAEDFDTSDEEHDLEHEEKAALSEPTVSNEASDSALADLEEGEDTKQEPENTGKRPPLFGRRNRRWGQKKNRKGDSPAD
jgi:hypothetical protein